jgi:hypothetical protein
MRLQKLRTGRLLGGFSLLLRRICDFGESSFG